MTGKARRSPSPRGQKRSIELLEFRRPGTTARGQPPGKNLSGAQPPPSIAVRLGASSGASRHARVQGGGPKPIVMSVVVA